MTEKNRFRNPHFDKRKPSIKQIIHSLKMEKKLAIAPHNFQFPNPRQLNESETEPSACWLGHSSFYLKCRGFHLITDPVWSQRCSPIPCLGPKRRQPVPYALNHFSKVHFVLISHNHYDHLDKKTVLKLHTLHPQIHWIVPIGVAKWFKKHQILNVSELAWHEEFHCTQDGESITITAVPTQHFSGRGLHDRNKSHWNGYVMTFKNLDHSKKAYFVGDTGYNPHDFKAIGEKYGPMDLSLIPIGAYRPRFFMREVHVNPEEAVMIHQEVKSKLSIGMHWKTFKLTSEKMHQPPYDLYQSLEKHGVSTRHFRVLEIGQTIQW
ncbi:MAG: MBL fold metallo-hydrolase [Simkania sp.]|nr:MBL fold metallo-hydrolase [Simkania sp.]MCP5490080.1 MBL fold metallo-hydrolase [Chlamydiales bacterium]